MNCSDALLDGVAKYAFEIGLNPLETRKHISFRLTKSCCTELAAQLLSSFFNLLLFAKFVLIIQELKAVQNGLHCNERISKLLQMCVFRRMKS